MSQSLRYKEVQCTEHLLFNILHSVAERISEHTYHSMVLALDPVAGTVNWPPCIHPLAIPIVSSRGSLS